MLYHLFSDIDVPGASLFNYVTFRSGLAFVTSLLFVIWFGKDLIAFLQKKKFGEPVRNLGLEDQLAKKGTPTMGGIIIIGGILLPCLLFGNLTNVYMLLMIISTLWLGALGGIDDYIKVFKGNKEGLPGKAKIVGQVGVGLIIGLTLYLSPDVVIRENTSTVKHNVEVVEYTKAEKSTVTTIPFVKNHNFDYSSLFSWAGEYAQTLGWILFVLVTIFVVTAVSNGANLTDGLDGLAVGTSATIGVALGILTYLSSHTEFASYLNIMYIPKSEELVVYLCAFVGATLGFLWYNSFPAQIFMGDTGSLMLGGVIATVSMIIRKELLIPILCGVFLVENLSVMIQVSYFKYTKKKYGEGRRIFLMSPLHHHYQKKGIPESKIVSRFWIVSVLLAVLTIVSLKVR